MADAIEARGNPIDANSGQLRHVVIASARMGNTERLLRAADAEACRLAGALDRATAVEFALSADGEGWCAS